MTQIHAVRFVSVNREALSVKPSKKKFWKKNWKQICGKKCWEKNFEKKMLEKNEKKILEKKYWKKNVGNKICKKKFWKKSFGKIFDKKNFAKINYKTQIFITKIYSNIDKCHTIFALLAPFDRTGWKTGSNENVCGIWFKIGSVACSHWPQGMWRFERSRQKRYNHGLRSVGNSLTTWAVSASSVVRKFCSGLVPTIKRRALNTIRKLSVVYISCSLVVRCWIYRC